MELNCKTLLTIILCWMTCASSQAKDKVTINGITYHLSKDEASVYKAERNIEVADIPAMVRFGGKEYRVTKIEGISFWSAGSFVNHKKLREVSIPNTVYEIGTNAFKGCSALKQVTIPNSVKEIGYGAFRNCESLETVILPDSPLRLVKGNVVKSGNLANRVKPFHGCSSIKTVKTHNGAFPAYASGLLPKDCLALTNSGSAIPHVSDRDYVSDVSTYTETSKSNVNISKGSSSIEIDKSETIIVSQSDIDIGIPVLNDNNTNFFAIIFANEEYQIEANVAFANNDGRLFKEYCMKTLGIPQENIHYRENATFNNMITEIDWLKKVASVYEGDAKIIMYYAGHGIPNESNGTPYLLPVDGVGNNVATAYSLNSLYETLGGLHAKTVTVFIDACFSGSQRGEGMLASARGVAIRSKAQEPKGNMVVFTAAKEDETAYPYSEKGHGLFTYFLLKKLKETKGNVTYGQLGDYIIREVSRRSIVVNSKSQTPTVNCSPNLKDRWQTLTFR